MTRLIQATRLDVLLTPLCAAPSPGAGAGAGAAEEAGLLACFRLPKSSGYLGGGQPWPPLDPSSVGSPSGAPSAGYQPSLPPGLHLLQLLGAALAERPPACEVLPEGVPGEAPARRPLWSASRRRPSFPAHPPGPPGSGLGSPSSWDRKPHISLEWGVARGQEADPVGSGHQLFGLTLTQAIALLCDLPAGHSTKPRPSAGAAFCAI